MNKLEQNAANFLTADNEAKELILSMPQVSASLPNYGNVPKSVVIVQGYTVKKTISETVPNVFSAVRQLERDEDNKPRFETIKKTDSEGKAMLDGKGNELFETRPIFSDKTKLVQLRKVTDVQYLQTLNVVPLKFKAKSDNLNDVCAAAFDDLHRAITSGRPVKVERYVNGEKKEIIVNVKTAFRADYCQIFVRIGNNIFSTTQVFGGIKGSLLKKDFHQFCSDAFKQLSMAQAQNEDEIIEIDSRILTALGMKKAK